MAILTKDDYLNRLHSRVGNDTSEDSISFIEDMIDTYNDMENKVKGDGVDWKKRYEELDEAWKTRYKHRFFTGDTAVIGNGEERIIKEDTITYDDLYREDK